MNRQSLISLGVFGGALSDYSHRTERDDPPQSPVCSDQAIEADLRRRELESREAGIFRNALKLCESVSIAGGRGGQHHHAEGSRGGRRNAIRIRNEFNNCNPAA